MCLLFTVSSSVPRNKLFVYSLWATTQGNLIHLTISILRATVISLQLREHSTVDIYLVRLTITLLSLWYLLWNVAMPDSRHPQVDTSKLWGLVIALSKSTRNACLIDSNWSILSWCNYPGFDKDNTGCLPSSQGWGCWCTGWAVCCRPQTM